ncbi:LysR family transcriptional regulator [Limnohabitans sp. T6-5]|uniref:LysR substrate-binding domain-containing protein n=1 Tax=Limnohabitans sp. T6-5 TaxID=1100724 RepID=UPI000D374E6C|nr:LysR substrate-binding domain-containing protein [Limnohabitans sp. T6-5]PUE11448.1 LysR family transcriptional regulator [Limnohabitans sp. T6-5]
MRRKLPSTQALICFEAAARHASFTKAAQELALTQGAVSRQVAALEDLLGVPLFKRGQHGMQLTPAGQDYVRQISTRLDALERDTLDLMGRQGLGESLTLAAVPTFASRWLIPRLPGFAKAHPQTPIHIETRTRPFMFSDSGLDAALYAGTPAQVAQWAGTAATHLFDEEVLPVCSPELLGQTQALPPEALAHLPLLQPSTRPEAWRQWFDAQGVDAPRAMAGPRYELFSMQVAAARCGLGVALMPTLLIPSELASGELVVACDRPIRGQRAYYLVQPQTAQPRPMLEHFKAWLLLQKEVDAAP